MTTTLTIGIDTREQTPWTFASYPVTTQTVTLAEGDYAIVEPDYIGHVAIERKSGSDLYGCMTTGRERFQAELERLRGYDFSAVVVKTTEDRLLSGVYGAMAPKSAKATLIAWQTRFPTHFIFCPHCAWAEKTAFLLMERFVRDVADGKRPAPVKGGEAA